MKHTLDATVYPEADDCPTWRDVTLLPLRDSPSYVYSGDAETEETVYLVGPDGELNPSDELCAAVEAALAKIRECPEGFAVAALGTGLENALERYRVRK